MKDWKTLRKYVLSHPGAVEAFPFGPEAAVFKVGGKIFAIAGWEDVPLKVSLKCDPDEAIALRSTYPSIVPAWHMNKRHWITLTLDGTLPDDLVRECIAESYALVFESLPKAVRAEIG